MDTLIISHIFIAAVEDMGVAFIKKGEVDKALPLLEQYLTEVGGAYGEDIAIDDYARKNGSPCRADSAHKVDCVNALSNLAAAQITAARNSTAVSFYLLRAIEIGDERMLGNVYANLGGHLAKIGDHDGAADAYIRGFWISLQQKNLDASAALLVS